MQYENITSATFLSRINRFVAEVNVNEKTERVHVKNTGRCKELLIPGCTVWLTEVHSPNRKTKYDLVTVEKENHTLFNIDSMAANKVTAEWLETQNYDKIIPEFTYGNSRIDFYMERTDTSSSQVERYLLEVKGCTLEIDGIGYFPDAPTLRGIKHLQELAQAAKNGFHAAIAFVIQMDGVTEVRPNVTTHPEFAAALENAALAGVKILYLACHVEPDSLEIIHAYSRG